MRISAASCNTLLIAELANLGKELLTAPVLPQVICCCGSLSVLHLSVTTDSARQTRVGEQRILN